MRTDKIKIIEDMYTRAVEYRRNSFSVIKVISYLIPFHAVNFATIRTIKGQYNSTLSYPQKDLNTDLTCEDLQHIRKSLRLLEKRIKNEL